MAEERQYKQNYKNVEQDSRDAHCRGRDPQKSEHSRNNRHNEKNNRPSQHDPSLSVRAIRISADSPRRRHSE
jgi:hypothetical protein